MVVSDGDASVAVRPAAIAPINRVAKGRQLGSWMSTTGATCGPVHDAVGGRVSRAFGSRPRDWMFAARVRASRFTRENVRGRSRQSAIEDDEGL